MSSPLEHHDSMSNSGDGAVGRLSPDDVENAVLAGEKSDVEVDGPSDVPWTSDDEAESGKSDDDDEGGSDALAALEEEPGHDGLDYGAVDNNGCDEDDADVDESPQDSGISPVFEPVHPIHDDLPINSAPDHEDANPDNNRSRNKAAKHSRGIDRGIEKRTGANEKPPSEKPSRTRRKSMTTREGGSPPRDGLFKKERDMIALNMKKLRAIARKAPVQVRIWTEPRKVKTPMDKYACAEAEAVCSDIFWAAIKDDLIRLQHLVQMEGVSVHTTMDPWMFHQTPLHWAAKGGAAQAIEFLVGCGADVYKRDDVRYWKLEEWMALSDRRMAAFRCRPLRPSFGQMYSGRMSCRRHLACWAGHTDAAMALLRAGDLKDLLITDYDANLNPLEWAGVRQHTECLAALNKVRVPCLLSTLTRRSVCLVL
ncbi:hypothetical protein, variant 2 [Aphanomyces invadans]|uniref:Uncharacterized protein n=1 Tax=Aphanomyces invadans TaxID=157072 RepID=A0A024UCK4_9STRA|nr:hypothetical protein, variant 2 [Aphanomyces invadans]ETW03358.1 hypothetical protein, variant 2 [Aphanomyces invadans]|eukprot:XP_008867587.1 hypothetical protein, variant 2 [Aphanomyces invadans]